jgi:hypothetical protein
MGVEGNDNGSGSVDSLLPEEAEKDNPITLRKEGPQP